MIYDFADVHHAQGYLVGGIVRHEDVPIVVRKVYIPEGYKYMRALFTPVGNIVRENVCELKDIDDVPVSLGMVNITKDGHMRDAIYLTRFPERRWKVGLMVDACHIHPVRQGPATMWNKVPHKSWWYGEDMRRCIMDEYPALDTGADLLKRSKERSIAISRGFAITGNHELMYRCNKKPVGSWEKGGCSLFPEYSLLIDQLMEDTCGQADIK